MNEKLIFLHIPKAGGSTFRPILRMQYPLKTFYTINRENGADFKELPLDKRQRVDVLRGHCFFGIHTYLPGNSCYVTFLRDPVERAISLYYYAQNGDGPFGDAARELSLRDFVLSGVCPELDNGQVRRVSGIRPAFGQVNRRHLEKALENIKLFFAGVGIVGYYDESLLLIAERLGWFLLPCYARLMVNTKKERAPLSASVRQEIREANCWDLALVQHCREMVLDYGDRRAARLKLRFFRLTNQVVGSILRSAYRLRRRANQY